VIGVKRYVVGFMLDSTLTKVVLIRKNRPEWQKGKLNGVGGKVEENESPWDAIHREFFEETGVVTTGWRLFSVYNGGDLGVPGSLYEIYFYWMIGDVTKPKTNTDEEVVVVDVSSLADRTDAIPNLRWLVQMARSFSFSEKTRYWDIQERYTCLEDVQ
jgi:8-oxo-dGTP diphosphatase